MIEQASAVAADPHAKELWTMIGTGIGTMVLVIGQGVLAHRKGQRRERGAAERDKAVSEHLEKTLDRKLMPISIAVDSLSGEVRDLKAHVIGPDGQNGLRGDVRGLRDEVKEIRADVDDIRRVDRERLERKVYDRRTGP